MSISLRKHAARLAAVALALSTMATFSAAALDEPVAVLSSNLNSSVGTVLTSDQILTAEQALSQAKAEADAKAKANAAAKAEAAQKAAYNALLTDPVATKTVAYSADLVASDLIKKNATSLGNYKLTFYDSCALCNGNSHGITASGTQMAEGRTIAVDPSVIPLGSRVYIEGYGLFIAEDTGGAIKGNKIDVAVSSHARAYELGVKYANVYLLD
jgi:3D (Asp-Asp-Asp) domain-containing protein